MSDRTQPDVIEHDRGRKLGVAGGQRCATCGVLVHWRIEKFCLQFRDRFGGRIYCMRCQGAFPKAS